MLRALITSELSSTLIKKLFYVTVFFIFAPLVLLISLMSLLNFSKFETHDAQVLAANNFQNPGPGVQVFASLPSAYPSVSGEVISEDARIEHTMHDGEFALTVTEEEDGEETVVALSSGLVEKIMSGDF